MPQQKGPGSLQRPLQLGTDTFKGITAGSSASGLRSAFYGKTMGEVELQRDLLNVQSPISGSTLTAPNSQQHGVVRDPITGTPLRLSCGHAKIVTPVMRQEQVCDEHVMLHTQTGSAGRCASTPDCNGWTQQGCTTPAMQPLLYMCTCATSVIGTQHTQYHDVTTGMRGVFSDAQQPPCRCLSVVS
jgi:hypothetical protein